MKLGIPASLFREFCLQPYFKGKSRLEAALEPLVSIQPQVYFPEGFCLNINSKSAFERSLYFRNGDPDTFKFIKNFLRPGMVFFDCGSHIGIFSMLASIVVGNTGKVYAFEPTPETYQRLVENTSINGLNNIKAFLFALGEKASKSSIYRLEASNEGMNSLAKEGEKGEKIGVCSIYSLDQIMTEKNLPIPDLVKIDVEGSELNLFKGAKQLITSKNPPTMIVELSRVTMNRFGYEPEDLVDYILSFNKYKIKWIFLGKEYLVNPNKTLPHYDIVGCNYGGNYIFEPQESI
jgi:FkbM family methyltransferase